MELKKQEKPHTSFIRIYYEDTDFTGAVYHANYLRYFERSRSDFLREIGMGHQQLLTYDPPRAFTIKTLTIAYFSPVRIEDLIEIKNYILKIGGASIHFHQKMFRGDQLVAELKICVVGIDIKGKLCRFPEDLREALKQGSI